MSSFYAQSNCMLYHALAQNEMNTSHQQTLRNSHRLKYIPAVNQDKSIIVKKHADFNKTFYHVLPCDNFKPKLKGKLSNQAAEIQKFRSLSTMNNFLTV